MTATEMHDKVLALWFYSDKDWNKTYKNLKDGVYPDVDKVLEGVDREAYITLVDADYPEECRAQLWQPFVIERKEEE